MRRRPVGTPAESHMWLLSFMGSCFLTLLQLTEPLLRNTTTDTNQQNLKNRTECTEWIYYADCQICWNKCLRRRRICKQPAWSSSTCQIMTSRLNRLVPVRVRVLVVVLMFVHVLALVLVLEVVLVLDLLFVLAPVLCCGCFSHWLKVSVLLS